MPLQKCFQYLTNDFREFLSGLSEDRMDEKPCLTEDISGTGS